jgi:cell division protein FtsB
MAKALFGSIVAPHELRVAEENAALRAKVRRLEEEIAVLREERDASIARELLTMAHESAAPALA